MLRIAAFLLALLSLASLAPAETFRNPRQLVTPVPPEFVLVADINGDGRQDLVYGTGVYSGGALHPLLAQPDGTYLPGVDLPLPSGIGPRCLAVDLNLDHIPDLVCPAIQNSSTVIGASFLGDGHGHFTFVSLIAPPPPGHDKNGLIYNVSGRSIAATFGDLNHDGMPDVVFTPLEGNTLYSLLGDGTGHLTAIALTTYTSTVHATLVDLNGDGNLDLLVSPFGGSGTSIFPGNGDGTFGPQYLFPGLIASAGAALGDFDGDSHLDLVSGNGGNLAIFHGNPDGSFNLNPIVTVPSDRGDYLGSIAVADLNGDGLPDILATASDGLTVFLGRPGLQLAPPVHYPVDQDFIPGGFFSRYAIADLNGDGHLDFIAAGAHGLWITYGRPDGSFSTATTYNSGLYTSFGTLVDVNEDGNPDIVTSGDTTLHLSLGRPDGTFQPSNPIPGAIKYILNDSGGYPTLPIVHGDFNGDHHQDLMVLGYPSVYTYNHLLLSGHGDSTFSQPLVLDTSNPGIVVPPQTAVGDINRDGLDDFASVDSNNVLVAWLSQGNGVFRQVRTTLPPFTSTQDNYLANLSITLADLDQDGILDIAFTTSTGIVLLHGLGDGTFNSPLQLSSPQASAPGLSFSGLTIGDFDGDGHPDLATLLYPLATSTGTQMPPTPLIFFNLGTASTGRFPFGPASAGPVLQDPGGSIASADFDGDGRADLLFLNNSNLANNVSSGNFISIFHSLPGRTFGPELDVVASVNASPLLIADLNHDGHPDLLSAGSDFNHVGTAFTVVLNLPSSPVPTGTLTATPEPSTATQPFSLLTTLQPPTSTPTAQLSGTVTFLIDGNSIGSAPLAANAATLPGPTSLAPGTHQLTANVTSLTDGITTYPPLTLTGTHTVLGIPTQLSLAATPNPTTVGQTTQLSATITNTASAAPNASAPTGTYTITDAATTLTSASVQSSTTTTATFQIPGTHTLTLTYSGDATHAPNTTTLTLNVLPVAAPTAFTLSLSPSALTIRGGQTATIMVTVNRTGSGPLTLQLTSGSLPPKSTATFATPSLAFTGAASASSSLAITTTALPPYLTQLHAKPSPGNSSRPLLALLLTTPLLAFALRRQRHPLPTLLTALLLAGTLLSLAGCGESFVKATPTPATTYAIPVAATDPATGITSVATLSLTVTP